MAEINEGRAQVFFPPPTFSAYDSLSHLAPGMSIDMLGAIGKEMVQQAMGDDPEKQNLQFKEEWRWVTGKTPEGLSAWELFRPVRPLLRTLYLAFINPNKFRS